MPTYPVLTSEKGQTILELPNDRPESMIDSYIEYRGNGVQIDLTFVDEVHEHLLELRDSLSTESGKVVPGSKFEALGSELVHKSLSGIHTSALADPDFWTWLTVAHFSELVEWRFNAEGSRAKLSNYGVHNPKENLIYRMWIRGEIGYDASLADPYELAKSGDQDLWRSHIIRQGYGNVRNLAKSLLRLQSGKLNRSKLGVAQVRELAKRIKRLRANVMLEALSVDETDALVLELSDAV